MSQSIRHSFLVDGQFATSTESQALAPMDDKIHITTDEPSWGKMEGLDSIPFPSLSLGEGETIGTPSSEGSEVSALEPPPESPVLDHEFSRVLQPEFKFQLAPEFLPEPISLAFHAASDRIFVGNRWSQAIECFSPLGHRVPLARPPVCDEPHTKYSFQIAVHPTKDLLFLCTAFQVFVFSMSNGLLLRTIGSIGKRDGQFLQAVAVAVHPTEDLVYVVDRFHSRVQVFDLEGTFVRKWGVRGESPGEFIEPSGIAIHPTRDLIFISDADTRAHNVQAFQADGTFLYRWGGFGNTPGKFNTPRHLVLHPNRSLLLVADFRNNRVQTFDLNGTFVGQFGGMGSGPEQFMAICGLAVDPAHELVYVADEDNKRVSVFSL